MNYIFHTKNFNNNTKMKKKKSNLIIASIKKAVKKIPYQQIFFLKKIMYKRCEKRIN